ncbi:MAG: ATP phosphoribosyltransferase regulatory subunit [Moraxella sp.]|nr:ATP phosphoribosyltransferase regulatory subunit [Moraxella sp.]
MTHSSHLISDSNFSTNLVYTHEHTADWLLPDGVVDVLFDDAQKQENLRTALLYVLTSFGYRLVSPPLIEYTETLLKNASEDLKRQTFKLIDQMTGRLMGLRSDITPQILRIDSQHGAPIARYCYAGMVVKTLPTGVFGVRTPMQLGAEIFGVADISADLHLLDVVCALFDEVGVARADLHIDVGHVGVFAHLCHLANLNEEQISQLIDFYQKKSIPSLKAYCKTLPFGADFVSIANVVSGDVTAVTGLMAQFSPALQEDKQLYTMLNDLAAVTTHVKKLGLTVSVDMGDLSGFHYHTGLVFGVYLGVGADSIVQSQALVRGGRFIGQDRQGKVRPATGFSMDINPLLSLVDNDEDTVILVDFDDLAAANDEQRLDLSAQVKTLQDEGCIVTIPLDATDSPAQKDGILHLDNGQWVVRLTED